MTEHEADVVVIGMGPGVARTSPVSLAEAGLAVVGVERLVGGECPYWGCAARAR